MINVLNIKALDTTSSDIKMSLHNFKLEIYMEKVVFVIYSILSYHTH